MLEDLLAMSEYYGSLASRSAIRSTDDSEPSSRGPTAAQILRRARQAGELTQRELAARAGVARAMISQYECGGREPSFATLRRLVGATGHELEWTLTPIRRPPELAAIAEIGWILRGELAAHGARRPRIVGHVARDEGTADTPVELLVELDRAVDGAHDGSGVDIVRITRIAEQAFGHPVRIIDAAGLGARELEALLVDAVPL